MLRMDLLLQQPDRVPHAVAQRVLTLLRQRGKSFFAQAA
jgi:hypothetical protein